MERWFNFKSDNAENGKEPVEELPKILSPEINDVFHLFAGMLDIKSFMNLARTSKDVYKRCMEDKKIRISVADHFEVHNRNGDLLLFHSGKPISTSYLAALRKLPSIVRMESVLMSHEANAESFINSRRFLKEIGVERIEKLEINLADTFTDSAAIVSFIKDFAVLSLDFYVPRQNGALRLILRTLLQLNLKRFCCDAVVSVDFILEMQSSIPELCFLEVENALGAERISKGQLFEILAKIQTGSLRRLILFSEAINWNEYDKLPFDHSGPLPQHRPLLFQRSDNFVHEYWFLHYHGGVTKCFHDHSDNLMLEIFKCEPWELPCALRKDEEILIALAEKHSRVSCSADQFNKFAANFAMIDPTHEGPLPDARPLYCKVDEYRFWMLDEDEILMGCEWADGCATWESFNPEKPKLIDHPALKKHVFWKVVKQVKGNIPLRYFCETLDEFDSWLEDYEKLDFEYSGILPSTRPLVFKGRKKNSRILLLKDRLLECELDMRTMMISTLFFMNCPPILMTPEILMHILKNPNLKNMHFNISFDVFRDGLELLKKSILVLQKRLLIAEKTETEYWYRIDGVGRKVVWEDGHISVDSRIEAILHESPPSFLLRS